MMNLLLKTTLVVLLAISLVQCKTRTTNQQTVNVVIQGNCGMCKTNIERAGNKKKEAVVNWNQETKQATLVYNSAKTTKEEILLRIAQAGYDNELYQASDSSYQHLHGCCQYQRKDKKAHNHKNHDHGNKNKHEYKYMAARTEADDMEAKGLNVVFYTYFKIKDGLIDSSHASTSNYAGSMYRAILSVNSDSFPPSLRAVWLANKELIKFDAQGIANSKDVAEQRHFLPRLSINIMSLLKQSEHESSIYLYTCPTWNEGKGGSWLTKEKEISTTPYQRLKTKPCGKLVETIN